MDGADHTPFDDAVRVFPGAPREDYSALPEDIRLGAEEIERHGVTILKGLLPPDLCHRLRMATQRVYAEEAAELGGEEALERIGDAGVSRSPFLRDDLFLVPMQLPPVLALARHFFGRVVQLNLQRVVMNAPQKVHGAAVWHRDFSYQDFTSSKPLALTAIAMLDGSGPHNGGASVLPGSHRFERFPSDDFARRHAAPVICEPGDVAVLDAACFHRGGSNIGDKVRHAVVTIYTVPVIRQNVDYPRLLGGRYADDPELRMLLGYDTRLPASDLEYRQEKLARNKRIAVERAV